MSAPDWFARAALAFHDASSFGRFETPRSGFEPATPTTADAQPSLLSEPLRKLLSKRRSTRDFNGAPLTREALEAIGWAAYGALPGDPMRRTAPSAGGLYPLHFVVAALRVDGLPRGFYSLTDNMAPLGMSDALDDVGRLFRTKHIAYQRAAAIVFVVGSIVLANGKYGERGYRYLLLEAGHAMQNASLACADLNLDHVPVGGLDDDLINAAIGHSAAGQVALYALAIGGAA